MTGIDTELTLTIDAIIGFASPSTLASIIQDIRQMFETDERHVALRDACELALIANVGEQEAAAMIGDDGHPDDDNYIILCPLCRKATASINDAPEQGWTPYYWIGREIDVDDPVCPACSKSRLTVIDGEPCLIGTAAYEPFPY